ncbi:MAG: DUF2127 domain-containing protein [Verrucomicrobia bacterium]|nr:DUF2127 domain-containing protein [Verrucomicrobiota bacterium]
MSESIGKSPRRRVALWGIILVKLGKGILLLLLALGVYTLSNNDLPHEFQHLLEFLKIDPERQFFLDAAGKLEHITSANVKWVAAGTAVYSLFSLVEAVGLMLLVTWACWLTIGESAFFIPIEVYELMRKPSLLMLVILALNIAIVWYLAANRNILFHKHLKADWH